MVKQPYFSPEEIDRLCEDELRKLALYPAQPEPIRIERYIERRFGISPDYERLPEGVLGYTEFGRAGVERIVLSAELDEDNGTVAQRRLRATMAHEAGHGILHAHLFSLEEPQSSLFGKGDSSGRQVLCRDVLGQRSDSRPKSSWSEYQANRAIGGLLVPRSLVADALRPFMVAVGALGGAILDGARRTDAEYAPANAFDVNPIVARIRLEELLVPQASGQLVL